MEITMKNKRVLITAGGSGICRTVAETFIKNGAKVHVCDMDKSALDEFIVLYPTAGVSLCDVSDHKQVSQLFADADNTLGGLDILINGAGIGGPAGTVDQIDI
jgi:NAD(P)-dependent dehydrogenase (short-subunit alcohol dehydrogenase family)